jgi:hypothetical protein
VRRPRRPAKRTDGFIAGLIREVLGSADREFERFEVHERAGWLAKGKHGKRNSPQYLMVEDTLQALVAAGDVEVRHVNGVDHRGHVFYRLAKGEA